MASKENIITHFTTKVKKGNASSSGDSSLIFTAEAVLQTAYTAHCCTDSSNKQNMSSTLSTYIFKINLGI